MPRYSLENQAGAIKSIQQNTLGSTLSGSSTTSSINAVDTSRSFVVSSGGSEQAPGVNISNSTTLQLIWRHNTTHYYRTVSTVIELFGGRGYE